MTTIATLAVKLLADAQGFLATMDQAENKTKSWSQNVSKNLKDAGGKITDFGKGMTAYVTTPIVGAALASIKLASDLNETKNKVHVIFGEMADDVMAWSRTSATAIGQSQQQALDNAASMALWGKQANLSAQETVKFAEANVQLASDMASFFNTSPQDALDAISAAYRGEMEPIRRYNVLLDQNALKHQAVVMGLIGEKDELTASARIMAANALIVQQTTAAHGDFANTANQLANSQRILTAQLADASAQLADQLLPYALQFVHWASDMVSKFQALTPEQQKWILIILGTLAVLGPLLIVIGSLITAIGAIIGVIGAISVPILAVIAVIAVFIAWLYVLYLAWQNNWFGIRDKTQQVIEFIKGIIAAGMQFIQDLTSGKLGWLSQMWRNTMDAIGQVIENALAIWRHIKQAWMNAVNGNWYMFGVELRKIWNLIMRTIGTMISTGWENLKLIWDNAIKKLWEKIKNINWAELGKSIIQGIINGLFWKMVELDQALRKIGQAIKDTLKGFFSIHSPSAVMKAEVGWELAAGTVMGFEEGVRKMLLPSIGSTMQFPSVGATPGMGAVSGAMAQPITVVVDYHPMISTADENEAKFVLAPMIEDEIRRRERKQ